MKKVLILSVIFILGISGPATSQSFIERALQKVDKVIGAADEALNGNSSTEQKGQSSHQSPAKTSASQNTPFWLIVDLRKQNLNGNVKFVSETRLWDSVESVSTFTYNAKGLVEEYKCEDGTVSYSYIEKNGTLHPSHISITLSPREYADIDWAGRQYTSSDVRTIYNDENGFSHDNGVEDKIKYTYLDGMKVIKADIEREGVQIVPSFFVYDKSGNLLFEYMESMDSQPVRELKYDAGGRKIYEKHPDGTVHEYTYNDNGDVMNHKISNTFGEDEDSESSFQYRYDPQGNWIEKVWQSGGETVATYTRAIEYYQ